MLPDVSSDVREKGWFGGDDTHSRLRCLRFGTHLTGRLGYMLTNKTATGARLILCWVAKKVRTEAEATEPVRTCFLNDWIETKHPHREDSSENPPSSSLTLQNRTPLTKGTEESSSSSKSTLNLNFFFFIIIKSIHSSGKMRRCSDLASRWHYPLIVLWWHRVVFCGRMVKLLVTTIKYETNTYKMADGFRLRRPV